MGRTKKHCDCKKEYIGVLKEPIVRGSSFVGDEERRAKVLIGWMTKLGALCDHFDIKETDPESKFFRLALALAQKHVPGFEVVDVLPKKHRPQDFIDDAHIYITVERQLKIARDENVRGAITAVITSNPEFADFKKTPDSLRTRYLRIKKSIEKFAQDIDRAEAKGESPRHANYSDFAVIANIMRIVARKYGAPEDEAVFEMAPILPPRIPKKKKKN